MYANLCLVSPPLFIYIIFLPVSKFSISLPSNRASSGYISVLGFFLGRLSPSIRISVSVHLIHLLC